MIKIFFVIQENFAESKVPFLKISYLKGHLLYEAFSDILEGMTTPPIISGHFVIYNTWCHLFRLDVLHTGLYLLEVKNHVIFVYLV